MKEETQVLYHEAINRVVEHINSHLYNLLNTKNLAAIANLSEYHFHRIFKSVIGESIGAYIIRLRLEHAAYKLQITSLNLNQIADQTAYQSKHALSKGFKKHFGINPSVFRNNQAQFAKQFKYAEELCPTIQLINSKTVVYIRIIGMYGDEDPYRTAWSKLFAFAKKYQLINSNTETLGISFDDPLISDKHCRFYACITTDKVIEPEGEFGVKIIDGGLYAIFTLKGSYANLYNLYNAICYNWLPNSGYVIRKGTMFEKYLNNPDKVSENEILTEIYVPIKQNMF